MDLPAAIGRYEIEELLGQGGMGRVLRARDSVLGRRVAIKIMRTDLGLPPEVRDAVLARMRQEARAAAAVSHPNMVTLHDMGEEDGVGLYLVFEYVEGPTLRQAIELASPDSRTPSLRIKLTPDTTTREIERDLRGALDPKDVIRIAREAASALDRAHAAGVIHRDIKPENVLLSELGAKITDFGIARMPDSTLTLQSTVMGTPAYSAPEALSQGAFSARSDQFSLACTIYEALTGERAFPGDDAMAVAAKVATEDPAPLRSVGGVLDRASVVLLRGMAKDPARRYATCTEMAQALDDALMVVISATPALQSDREALREHAKIPESAVMVVGPASTASFRRKRTTAVGITLGVAVVGGAALLLGLGGKIDARGGGLRSDAVLASASGSALPGSPLSNLGSPAPLPTSAGGGNAVAPSPAARSQASASASNGTASSGASANGHPKPRVKTEDDDAPPAKSSSGWPWGGSNTARAADSDASSHDDVSEAKNSDAGSL